MAAVGFTSPVTREGYKYYPFAGRDEIYNVTPSHQAMSLKVCYLYKWLALMPLGSSRKRVGFPISYGGTIARTGIRDKVSPIPIITGITSAYLSSFGC